MTSLTDVKSPERVVADWFRPGPALTGDGLRVDDDAAIERDVVVVSLLERQLGSYLYDAGV